MSAQTTDWLIAGSTLPQALILMHQQLTCEALIGCTGHPVVVSTRDEINQFGGGPTEVIPIEIPTGKTAGTPSSQPHATLPHSQRLRDKSSRAENRAFVRAASQPPRVDPEWYRLSGRFWLLFTDRSHRCNFKIANFCFFKKILKNV